MDRVTWKNIFKLQGHTRIELLEKRLRMDNLIHDKQIVSVTNCGSQLVDMLEEFYREYWGKRFIPLLWEEWRDYSKEYADWLHEKNSKTYYGLIKEIDSLDITDMSYWKVDRFKMKQKMKGITVYG